MVVKTLIAVSLACLAVVAFLNPHCRVAHRRLETHSVHRKPVSRESGFTIIELMVTLAVAVIVLTIAVPSFTAFVSGNRISSQANQFVAAMNFARSEAIKRKVNIDVAATDSGTATDEWGAGWTVTINGGATLKAFPPLEGSSTLNSNGGVDTFQYQPNGNVTATDTLELCDDRTGETGRQITVTNTGRVVTANLACA